MMGQMPEWTIPAENETLEVKANNVVQGSAGKSNKLWNMDGKKLFSTDDKINAFSNDVATIKINNSNKLSGFVDTNGKFIELPQVEIAHDYPYFEDGFLVAKQAGNYVMYHKIGDEINIPMIEVLYPYSNGFATYYAYQQPEKKKNPYFNLLMQDGNPIKNFVIKEKEKTKMIEPKDISFISSVGADTWRALAVVKNKLYWFDTFEMYLIPILIEDEDNKKKQLVLESNKALSMQEFPSDTLTIVAKYGKDKRIEFRFDNLLRLVPNYNNISAPKAPTKPFTLPSLNSTLSTYIDGEYMGITDAQNNTLPAQFDEIGIRYDNKAFAKKNGKWGVIELIPDCNYSISINDGEDVSFSHHSTDAKLKIEFPSRIDANKVIIDFPESSGIKIDKGSRVAQNTEKGNSVIYNCTLEMPSVLTTDTISAISYGPGSVTVDNVRLQSRNIPVNAKYENNYIIEIPYPDAQIPNGEAAFEIRVKRNNDDKGYPYDFSFGYDSTADIDSKSILTSFQKLSEDCYMCFVNVADLQSGINPFKIEITEEGCPQLTFPIEIEYSNVRRKEKATVRHKLNNSASEENQAIDAQPEGTIAYDTNAPKRIVFDDGYFVGEVIASDVNVHSGPGNNFPISQVYSDYDEKMVDCYPLIQGERLKVKEEGDWYLIYDKIDSNSKEDPRYVSKQYIKPIESKPFNLNEISKPTAYVKIDEAYEDDDMTSPAYLVDIIVLYPKGLAVQYYETFQGAVITTGTITNGEPTICFKNVYDAIYEKSKAAKHSIVSQRGIEGVELNLKMLASEIKSSIINNEKIPYPDLSKFSEEEWKQAIKAAKTSKYYIKEYQDINKEELRFIITKDELEKNYTKIK